MDSVLQFDKGVSRYLKRAAALCEKEEYLGALKFLFSAKALEPDNVDVIAALGDVYADMSALELSNKYWFEFMDKAPKERQSVAYEELAINYFYLDNYWASSYYFHKKLSVDGFISKEGLSQEIIDFFSGEEIKRTAYRIVYPFDKADYTFEIKQAKHAIALGGFEEGASFLEKIPLERRDEETAGELAVCYFMSDRLDEAEEVCRQSLEQNGPTVTAFCNLSTVYDMKEDFDNSEHYYQKALEVRKGDTSEAYKIATCAIEREDHKTASECLKTILEDRPFEHAMRFFYGLALANLGDLIGAERELSKAHLIDPEDYAINFHLNYVKNMLDGGGDYLNLTPFKYVKDIPETLTEQWKKKIKTLIKTPEKISSAIKKKEWKEILEWGLKSTDSEFMRDCAFVLSSAFTPYSKGVIFKAMLSPEGREELKRVLIYVTLVNGVKDKFGVVAGGFYLKVKPRKLLCERDKIFGGLYLSAYALCMSKMAFFDVESLDKIAKNCDKIYKKFKGEITDSDATNEDIAALILSECKFKKYSDDFSVLRIFSVTKDKLTALKKTLKGE